MAVVVRIGDVFSTKMQTLVNTINCRGVMGAGIALRCKQLYPEVFEEYAKRCAEKAVIVGEPYLSRRNSLPWVLNFPTKKHWRHPSKLEYIATGLAYLAQHYQEWGISSLAFPALGCGNGGLTWQAVGPLMGRHLAAFTIPIEIYAPLGTPEFEMSDAFLQLTVPTVVTELPAQGLLFDVEPRPTARKPRNEPKNKRKK